jgi:hypothetical protein
MSPIINYRSKVPGAVAISDDQIRQLAPSVFTQPIESVSERYSVLLTSSILKGMRENGWVPVRSDCSRRRPAGSRMPRSRAIKGIDEDMKLNKALWQMAEVLRTSRAQ